MSTEEREMKTVKVCTCENCKHARIPIGNDVWYPEEQINCALLDCILPKTFFCAFGEQRKE